MAMPLLNGLQLMRRVAADMWDDEYVNTMSEWMEGEVI